LGLTEVGRVVFRYADEIFALGQELKDTLKGQPSGKPVRLFSGVSDQMPKLIAYRVLRPSLGMVPQVQLHCIEDRTEHLLAALAAHELDLILTDAPAAPLSSTRSFNHLLGSCSVALFATPALAARYRRRGLQALNGAPFLLPAEGAALRRTTQRWFAEAQIRPRVVGEFQDSALLKAFGQSGAGIFPAPSAISREVCGQYGVVELLRMKQAVENFYLVTAERKLRNPAAVLISEVARANLFGHQRR
jgi:LysR family transcriptional activator of nhaA